MWGLLSAGPGLGTSGAAFGTQGPQELAENPKTGLDNFISSSGKSILHALMFPGRVYQSAFPWTSEGLVPGAVDLAGLLVGIPSGVGGLGSGARINGKAVGSQSVAPIAANTDANLGSRGYRDFLDWSKTQLEPMAESARKYDQAVLQQQWDRVLSSPITDADREAVRGLLTDILK